MNAQSLFAHLHALLDAADPHIINHAEDREERIPVFHYAAAPAHADDESWLASSMGRAMTCWRCTADTMVCNCLHGKTTLRLA